VGVHSLSVILGTYEHALGENLVVEKPLQIEFSAPP
jgi:hypothetical protein